MNYYPKKSVTLNNVLELSFQHYFPALKATALLMLLSALLKNLWVLFAGLIANHYVYLGLLSVVILLQVYLISLALFCAHQALSDDDYRVLECQKMLFSRLSSVFKTFFAFVLGACLLEFLAFFMGRGMILHLGESSNFVKLAALFVMGIPLSVYFTMFYFVVPLAVIDRLSWGQAFMRNIDLLGRYQWLRALLPYSVIILLLYGLSPDTWHGYWLRVHHLATLADALVIILLFPLIANLTLFLLNDLKLRI